MEDEDKMESAIDRLLFLKGLAMQSDFYLVDSLSVEEAFRGVLSAIQDSGSNRKTVAWWDGGSALTRHEKLPKAHNWRTIIELVQK